MSNQFDPKEIKARFDKQVKAHNEYLKTHPDHHKPLLNDAWAPAADISLMQQSTDVQPV